MREVQRAWRANTIRLEEIRDGGMTEVEVKSTYCALCTLGVVRTYPRKTIVIQEGDRSDQVYAVVSGRLKVFLQDSDGNEIIVDMLGPGQYFGEMALDGSPRSASVMTLDATRLAIVDRDVFKQFLAQYPEAAFSLILTLIRRARNLTQKVGGLALLDVYGRVARLLIDHAVDQGGRKVVATRMSQQEMALRVGASREMVWRILDELREGKYISMENNQIIIEQALPERW